MDMIIALAFPLLHLEHFSSAHVDREKKKNYPQSTKINTSVIFCCFNNE